MKPQSASSMTAPGPDPGPPRASSRSVAWVLVSITHYHHARMAAFAAEWPHPTSIVQITDTDAVRVLEARPERPPYALHTLLPGVHRLAALDRALAGLVHRALDRIRPEVVCINGWSYGGAIESLQWALRNGARAVVMSESAVIDAPRSWLKERIKHRVLAMCSAALAGGAPHVSYLESLGMPRGRIFDGYDAVDNGHFEAGAAAARRDPAAARSRLGIPGPYFLAASRFEPKKNLPRLLEAYAEYRRLAGAGAWDLALLGDGHLRPELAQLASSLALDRSLHMPGFASYAEMPGWYALSQCFIHASTTEQWGLVVNEAMASGAPVLVSDRCGCCADLVRQGRNGYRFDPFDASALARLMLRCQRESAALEGMGAAGRELIRDWGPSRFARGLSMAAESALAGTPRRASAPDRALLAVLAHPRV
jgi:glycosyltransferase involved in cell wall biosynthesis